MGFAYKIHDQNGVYFITCTVVQWVDVFTRREYADIIVASLRYCQLHKGLEILAWVIMSNHVHLIVSSRPGNNLSDTLRDFKRHTATAIVDAIEKNNQESRKNWLMWLLKNNDQINFWQPGNHAEEINGIAFFKVKRDYIHANPVKAGIVNKEETYTYSSAIDYYGGKGLIELTYFD